MPSNKNTLSNKNILIDTHVHMYPDLDEAVSELAKGFGLDVNLPKIKLPGLVKNLAQKPQKKINQLLQMSSPHLRSLPKELLPMAEKIHGAASLGGTVANGSMEDLLKSMDENGVAKSIVIAHPPLISNEFALNACSKSDRLYPVVNIPKGTKDPEELLKSYIERGAVALKIHAAADGLASEDSHYHSLLAVANEAKLPVIIHTGCIHIKPFYKDPQMGHVENFKSWFSRYRDINFVLAHMNYHYPQKAIDLCLEFENVYCDCSWQPVNIIQEALEKIPQKIMFGTDWPIVGSNQEVMVERIKKTKMEGDAKEAFYSRTARKIFNV